MEQSATLPQSPCQMLPRDFQMIEAVLPTAKTAKAFRKMVMMTKVANTAWLGHQSRHTPMHNISHPPPKLLVFCKTCKTSPWDLGPVYMNSSNDYKAGLFKLCYLRFFGVTCGHSQAGRSLRDSLLASACCGRRGNLVLSCRQAPRWIQGPRSVRTKRARRRW